MAIKARANKTEFPFIVFDKKSGKYAGTGKISEKRNETGIGCRGDHLFRHRNDKNGKSQQTKTGSTGRSASV